MGLRIIPELNDRNGRWMWKVRDGNKHICTSGIHGFGTKPEALAEAKRVFGSAIEIEGEYGPEYAGARDFSD